MRGLGMGLGLRRVRNRAPAAAYDPASQAYFDRLALAGGTMIDANKAALNTWFVSSAVYRPRLRRANFYMADDLAGSMVPQVAQVLTAKDTNHGFVGGDFSVANGLQNNGAAKYLDTGFDPQAMGFSSTTFGMAVYLGGGTPVYAGDSAPIGSYGLADDRSDMGATNFTPSAVIRVLQGNAAGAGDTNMVVPEALLGMFSMAGQLTITGQPKIRIYSNGAPAAAAVSANAWTGAVGAITPFALNLQGNPSRFWPGKMFGYVLFDSLGDADHLALYNDLHTLFTAIGRAA